MRRKISGIILGAVLIAAGVFYALDAMNILKINFSLDGWWTLFIIVPSVMGLISGKDKTGNLIALAIGVYLLLAARGIIEYGLIWKLLVPTVIILLGVKLIAKSVKEEDDTDVLEDCPEDDEEDK